MTEDVSGELNRQQIARLAGEGLLTLVPYVGSALATFTFGTLTARRINRIEQTLAEVVELIGEDAAKAAVNEDFVNLLEHVAPELSRATDEKKRQRFRDLLANAAVLPEGSSQWSEATLAANLLREIDTPGMAILAGLAQLPAGETVTLTSLPEPQIARGEYDYVNPGEVQHAIPFSWDVVEYWTRWLRERRLLGYGSHDGHGGFGGVTTGYLGRFLVAWVLK